MKALLFCAVLLALLSAALSFWDGGVGDGFGFDGGFDNGFGDSVGFGDNGFKGFWGD